MFLLDYLLEYNRYMNLIGIAVVLGIAILFSKNRAQIKFKLIGVCLLLQTLIALAVLKKWRWSSDYESGSTLYWQIV